MHKPDRLTQDQQLRASRPTSYSSTRRSCEDNEAIVVTALAQASHPLSAYNIVAYSISTGQKLAPAQVYRTLARLIEKERVGRIESLSAFALKRRSTDVCLIESSDQTVEWVSAPDLVAHLFRLAKASGFKPSRTVVEIHGDFVR